jgi:hypothetical protein
MNNYINQVYYMYRRIQLGSSPTCCDCHQLITQRGQQLRGPVPIYHVGEKFHDDDNAYRILFLGAVAYGFEDMPTTLVEVLAGNHWEDAITWMEACARNLFQKHASRFWGVIRSTVEKLYGLPLEVGYQNIAVSNFVKCNLGGVDDDLPVRLRRNCAHQIVQYVTAQREAEVIAPRTVIALTTREGNYLKGWETLPDVRKLMLPHPAHSSWSNDQYAQCIATWLTHPSKAMEVYQDLICWASKPCGDEHA